jgi:hypothetical protein
MAIIRQPAYITKSPISVAIGGVVPVPFPPTPVIPAQDFQINGVLQGTGRGKWVGTIDYYRGNIGGPTSWVFSDLEGTSGSFFSDNMSITTTSVSAPNLIYVGGSLLAGSAVVTYSNLTSINFPKLKYIGGSAFGPNGYPALTSIDFPELVFMASSFTGTFNGVTSMDLSKLQIITNGLFFSCNSLTSLSLPSLVICLGSFSLNVPALTTLDLPTLGTWKAMTGNISLTNIALNQTSVNDLLAALAYMDGNNGTLLFGTGKIVSITGTSSAPSNLGSTTTAGSNFVGVGTTCTVNWTGHGYATGDVLRISGITTLTNANRYAVITVVNPNQFTYTITSQSATGAGTATVIKAGASAAALVNRGVTLTTN